MQHRSTDTDETGVCQELLPSSDKRKDSSVGEERINMIPNIQSHHQNRNQHNKPHHSESGMFPSEKDSLSPQSTFTTETGNQLLYRLKTSGFNPKLSWTSNSAQLTPNDGGTTGTLNSTQKFSMKQIAIFPPRVKRRVVLKNGAINVNKEHVERRHQRYLQDTFTTMVDIKWRWNLLVFTLAFILSWLGFACVWWIICLAHGDLEPEHLSDESWTPW
jgi:potassium inwardly-rectifying channel subfamily J